MVLDLSKDWRIVRSWAGATDPDPRRDGGPADFAATELSEILGRMSGRAPGRGGMDCLEYIIVLDAGRGEDGRGSSQLRPRSFSWRASPDRVEIYGSDGGSLLRGAYDFLEALGARWIESGEWGERLPRAERLPLETSSRTSGKGGPSTTLVLGHGAYLEDWEDRLLWAARAGYDSVFIQTTPEALALDAAPESLYESLSPSIATLARRLGLALELGGRVAHSPSPRAPTENGGEPCASSDGALAAVAEAFAARAIARPEITAFHAWPDEGPGEFRCACPTCESLSPSARSLKVARALAAALARSRPDASLSFLACRDPEEAAEAIVAEGKLPPNLSLLWAPRRRSWGCSIGDEGNSLNAASLSAFGRAARAWRSAGGGSIRVFERWEDGFLFKGALPPLAAVIEGDIAAYAEADSICLLCAGGRLPLGPRPNPYLLPRLAAGRAKAAPPREMAGLRERVLADWARAAYGEAAAPMLEYWRELEAAWAIDLDLREGDTAVHLPGSPSLYASDPPSDWGDPWKAGLERLKAKRDRCEELFDHLRLAEARLSEAMRIDSAAGSPEARALRGEASEGAISGAFLELDCARLSAYHELASGDGRAAADIANIALSVSEAVREALKALPDRRSRREIGFLVYLYYDLRLRAIRRANARSGLRRLLELWFSRARGAVSARLVSGAYGGRRRAIARAAR
jgi:hypothetical protein